MQQGQDMTGQSCSLCGSTQDLQEITFRSLEDESGGTAWYCTNRQACLARFAPEQAQRGDERSRRLVWLQAARQVVITRARGMDREGKP
jgi:hypothetical protein